MILRKAKLEDAEKVANVFVTGYNVSDSKEAEEIFLKEIESKNFIVAEEDDKILGFVSWAVRDLPKHELAELCRIVSLPEHRGKGISKILFERMLSDINIFYLSKSLKIRKLFLFVHASNERAKNFYKKIGFFHEATLKDHMYEGEDELIFSMFFNHEK
ncbi:MAG: GNAT family N-acetyltransferase [Nanoarchaeota archaeon]